MIVYVLFVHKKSVSKRKVCIIFLKIKNLKAKKNKKPIFNGFLGGFFWVGFFGGFFIANPDLSTPISLLSHPFLHLSPYLRHPSLFLATYIST
jgi:hypothetical protein